MTARDVGRTGVRKILQRTGIIDESATPLSTDPTEVAQLLEAEQAGRDQADPAGDAAVYHQLRKGGTTVPTEVRARVLRDPTTQKPLLLSVSRDISQPEGVGKSLMRKISPCAVTSS